MDEMQDIRERISDADRALLGRLNVRMRAAGELQALVQEHFASVYGLKSGDTIEDDGTIIRDEAAGTG